MAKKGQDRGARPKDEFPYPVCRNAGVDRGGRKETGWLGGEARSCCKKITESLEKHLRKLRKQVEKLHQARSRVVPARRTERLAEAGVEPSIGSVGDPYAMPSPAATEADRK